MCDLSHGLDSPGGVPEYEGYLSLVEPAAG
jgi:hypothetical protein